MKELTQWGSRDSFIFFLHIIFLIGHKKHMQYESSITMNYPLIKSICVIFHHTYRSSTAIKMPNLTFNKLTFTRC